jgi:hypothetical protein
MNTQHEKTFIEAVRRGLARHEDSVDAVTAARLRAMRSTVLTTRPTRRHTWYPAVALASAAAVLVAVAIWLQQPAGDAALPQDWEALASSADMELIEELDFYAWLDETEPNS